MSRDLFDGSDIFAKDFEFLSIVAVKMIVQRFSAYSAAYPLISVHAPEDNHVSPSVVPFLWFRKCQFDADALFYEVRERLDVTINAR